MLLMTVYWRKSILNVLSFQRTSFPCICLSRLTVYLLLPTSTYFYLLLPTSTYIYLLLPTSTCIYLLLPISTYFYLFLTTSNYIYLHLITQWWCQQFVMSYHPRMHRGDPRTRNSKISPLRGVDTTNSLKKRF